LSQLKAARSSSVCDTPKIDKLLCFELYYYLFYFNPNVFYSNKNVDNCEICEAIEKCSLSQCNKFEKIIHTKEISFIQRNDNQTQTQHNNDTKLEPTTNPFDEMEDGMPIFIEHSNPLLDNSLFNDYIKLIHKKAENIKLNINKMHQTLEDCFRLEGKINKLKQKSKENVYKKILDNLNKELIDFEKELSLVISVKNNDRANNFIVKLKKIQQKIKLINDEARSLASKLSLNIKKVLDKVHFK
jgi:hypothetical protein